MMIKAILTDSMGNDLTVCNAARVSLGKRTTWEVLPGYDMVEKRFTVGKLRDADRSLIRFLERGMSSRDWSHAIHELAATHNPDEIERIVRRLRDAPRHWTPFSHIMVQMHIVAPLFVARQAWKSNVGFSGGDAGYPGWNEESRRYVDAEPQFWRPIEWRSRAANIKQGSAGAFRPVEQTEIDIEYEEGLTVCLEKYEWLLARGVAPEQARAILPGATIVEWYWTASIAAWARLHGLRADGHAQAEIRELARQISDICAPIAPVSWAALTGQAETPSGFDVAATDALR